VSDALDAPGWLDPSQPSRADRRTLDAWLALQIELALFPQQAWEALRREGGPRAALRSLRPHAAPPVAAARRAMLEVGAVLLPGVSARYPSRLTALADPPLALAVRGDPDALSAPSVAIVGARAASVYGKSAARAFASELAHAGVVVVSGLALGIDAAAHEAALDAGGRTVAVLARGIDGVYPARHRGLADRIEASGAIVTEMPPGTSPLPAYFPLRNRIISGLARAVLVVEAREKSGSLLTAGHAADQGVEVLAVPGPITAPTSAGTNRLLRDGAAVALEAEDVLSRLGLEPRVSLERSTLTPDQHRIVEHLARDPATRDALAAALGRTGEQIALDLLELELGGRIAEDRDGRLRLLC
jgi:DNA processing protein